MWAGLSQPFPVNLGPVSGLVAFYCGERHDHKLLGRERVYLGQRLQVQHQGKPN